MSTTNLLKATLSSGGEVHFELVESDIFYGRERTTVFEGQVRELIYAVGEKYGDDHILITSNENDDVGLLFDGIEFWLQCWSHEKIIVFHVRSMMAYLGRVPDNELASFIMEQLENLGYLHIRERIIKEIIE